MKAIKEAKAQARILKTFMAEQGVNLAHGVALEAVARLAHHKNWATYLVALTAADALVKTLDDVAGWPTYVFFFDEREEGGYREQLFVLPQGVTLEDRERHERWGPFLTDGAEPVPDGFALSDKVVATKVYSTAPSVDKYGLPHYADEDKAPAFFREDLHCAALDGMDVSFTDTGDDSSSRYWFEARVHPEVAKLLDTAFAPVPLAATLDKDAPPSDDQLVTQAYRIVFERAFAHQGGASVADIMDALAACKSPQVTSQAWLRTKLGDQVLLQDVHANVSCPRLLNFFKEVAKDEFENLLMARSRARNGK